MWALMRSVLSRLAPLSLEVGPPMEVLPHSLGTREQGETGFLRSILCTGTTTGRDGLVQEGEGGEEREMGPVPCENY